MDRKLKKSKQIREREKLSEVKRQRIEMVMKMKSEQRIRRLYREAERECGMVHTLSIWRKFEENSWCYSTDQLYTVLHLTLYICAIGAVVCDHSWSVELANCVTTVWPTHMLMGSTDKNFVGLLIHSSFFIFYFSSSLLYLDNRMGSCY